MAASTDWETHSQRPLKQFQVQRTHGHLVVGQEGEACRLQNPSTNSYYRT